MTRTAPAPRPPDLHTEKTYALLSLPGNLVLPMEQAIDVFRALGQALPVSYDWQSKTHRIAKDTRVSLQSFSLQEYATLQLNEE